LSGRNIVEAIHNTNMRGTTHTRLRSESQCSLVHQALLGSRNGTSLIATWYQVSSRLAKGEEIDYSIAMINEDEHQALQEEHRLLKALVAERLLLHEHVEEAQAQIKELDERVAHDCRTSRKPSSSDRLKRLSPMFVVRAGSVREARRDMLGTHCRWWSSQLMWCVTIPRSVASDVHTSMLSQGSSLNAVISRTCLPST
jgi:hypothetical protein